MSSSSGTPTLYSLPVPRRTQVLHASAASSATGLRCAVQIDPARFGQLRFSWRVREAPVQADVGVAEHDDCPARLVLWLVLWLSGCEDPFTTGPAMRTHSGRRRASAWALPTSGGLPISVARRSMV